MIFGPSVSVVQVPDISDGYLTLSKLSEFPSVEILFGAPIANGNFLILLNGNLDELKKGIDLLGPGASSAVIEQIDEDILPAVFAQNKHTVEGGILVFSSNKLPKAFEDCQNACSQYKSIKVIDFRLGQSSGGVGVVTLTGTVEDLKNCQKNIKGSSLIEKPHEKFKNFFQPPVP